MEISSLSDVTFGAFDVCWDASRCEESFAETPWVRQVVSGTDLLRNPRYSKGFAFDHEERDRLHLRGLMPSSVNPQGFQAQCAMMNVRRIKDDLEKYHYLLSLNDRNERLFYRVLMDHFEELLPIIHNPTVRRACEGSPIMFRNVPKAMYISPRDKGHIHAILDNWPYRRVKLMIITDGAVVGPLLGADQELDLGVEAVGVPASKAFLYTVCGGIHPEQCVPVCIDVGTNNRSLQTSQFYVGVKHDRIHDEAYLELMDEFLAAVKKYPCPESSPLRGLCRKYGNTVMLQFVDMKHETAMQFMSLYRSDFPCLHDGSHGRAATMLAGVLSALPLTKRPLEEHTILLSGEGALVSITAEMFANAMARQTGHTAVEGRKKIWIVDSNGLVVRGRPDHATIDEHKIPFMHLAPAFPDLESAVKYLKPSILLGCSFTAEAPFKFTKTICQSLAEYSERPMIFPLSPSGAECSIKDLMEWTDGRAVTSNVEGGSASATLSNGSRFVPRQCHTTYIFPGMALGTIMSRSNHLKFEQFIAAAHAVARLVTPEDLKQGWLYPPLSEIREVAANVAQAVAQKSYESGTATNLPEPKFLLDYARNFMFVPDYKIYR